MAAIAGTVLENAVLMATDRFQQFEKRRPDLGVVGAFTKYGENLIDAATIKKNRASARRTQNIAVLNRQQTTIYDTRSLTHAPMGSTSAKVGLNWKTYRFDVGVTEAINADNYISASADLANQLEQGIRDVLLAMDADFTTFTELGKYSALPASSLMGISGGAYQTTQKDLWINLPAVMRKLMLQGPYHMLSNVEALANLTNVSTYGQANQQNLQKLINNYEFGYSPNINPGGSKEAYYAIPTGSVAMVDWVEYDCRKPGGRGSYDGGEFYDTMTLEFTALGGEQFSLTFGFRYLGGGQDKSAILPGLERAYTDSWQLAVDVAPVKAYSSEAGKSPIVKILADAV
ncbi:hypothetical protein [Spirosoma radiotolerans]|uniref:Phage capsid protein n=1 Tax=Spirosoma radiotolerans TaxID=1379870 RepID=A0A0E3ZVB3_9BACT|nr:hypothetical protein [Spirosoma radiotolerans]AKD55025.1 hypothetical protein SD10_09030 [Spirosoma radiotolerans]